MADLELVNAGDRNWASKQNANLTALNNAKQEIATLDEDVTAIFDDPDSALRVQANAAIAGGDARVTLLARLRAAYKDPAVAYAAPAVTPTVTPSAAGTTATSISGGVRIQPANPDGSLDGIPIAHVGSDGVFGPQWGTTGIFTNYVRHRALTGSSTNRPCIGYRFGLLNASEFELKITGSTANYYRLRIDDRWVSEGEEVLSLTNGSQYLVKFSGLDATKPHIYQIDLLGAAYFGGIFIPPTAAIWKPDVRIKAALLLDSIGGGANAGSSAGASQFSTFWERACDLMGWDGRYNLSEGGTGVTTPGTGAKFQDRVEPDLNPIGADVIVTGVSRNDNGSSLATVQAAAEAHFHAVIDGNPQAFVIALGAWMDGATMGSGYVDANTAGLQAAAAVGIPFVDFYTGTVYDAAGDVILAGAPWVTGNGNTSSVSGTGSADWITGADDVHPTRLGHDYIARRCADVFRAIIDNAALT